MKTDPVVARVRMKQSLVFAVACRITHPSEQNSIFLVILGLGAWGNHKFGPQHFSTYMLCLKSTCVCVKGLRFMTPLDFSSSLAQQELIFGWPYISSRQLSLLLWRFLISGVFFVTDLVPLAILCCCFFILLGLCKELGGINLSC